MLQTFEFKPAPIARPVRVEVDDVGATLRDSQGRVRSRLEFSSARSARFAQMGGGDAASRWFDVEHGRGRFRLKCNSSTPGHPGAGHLAQYRAAVDAILAGLEARAPAVQVDLGIGRHMRIVMLSIAGAFVLGGVGLPTLALAMGQGFSKVATALLPSAFLVLMGIVLWAMYRPTDESTLVPLAALRKTLAG